MHHGFLLFDRMPLQEVLDALRKNHPLKPDGKEESLCRYLDTFDWRLYKNGWALSLKNDTLHLLNLENAALIASAPWTDKKPPQFHQDLPESLLRDLVTSELSVRGLIPLLTMMRQRHTFRMLNADKKTVVLLHSDTLKIPGNCAEESVMHRIVLQSLRGYDAELNSIALELAGLGAHPAEEAEMILGCRAVGLMPGDYSSKFRIDLDPDMSAHEAMKKIYLALSEAILKNKPGIIEDTDIEFLHDYRVAIRRTRAGLALVRDVLPATCAARFKSAFSELGGECNHLRDLDVYLLEEENYRCLLPEPLKAGLVPLFGSLRRERDREQKRVATALTDPRSDQIIHEWRALLSACAPDSACVNAKRPVTNLANALILPLFEKTITSGRKIKSHSPDDKLHRLRLQCKKLRYLMEFFASLYPDDKISFLIKQLKQLQDNLGMFNDLCVQQAQLNASLCKIRSMSKTARNEAAAIGGLLVMLHNRQQKVRRTCKKAFSEFSGQDNQMKFQELFDAHHGRSA